ncbi:hypothetical protein [Sphingomonas sp. VNH70]|uniref:hypothetical protein n=1 Tax=Sphingomonas silueang TaxID=3156617 RepID=UPI0032B56A70
MAEARAATDDIGQRYWGYGIGLLTLAWFSAPLIRYADAVELARCGLSAFVIVLALERAHRGRTRRVRQLAAGMFLGATVMTVLFATQIFVQARELAWHNDRRCRVMEAEMLRGSPRRGDLPDMFQAFGCRPQGDAMPRRP